MKKNSMIKKLIGGSAAAVLAIGIALPAGGTAAAASFTSYDQLIAYIKQHYPQGAVVVSKPVTPGNTTSPSKTAAPAPSAAPAPAATPAPVQTPAVSAPASASSEYVKEVISLVNQERAKAGLAAVSGLDSLHKVAAAKAQDMRVNQYFSHTSPTYGSPFDMMKAFGITYKAAGENIAMGQKTPQEVVTAWMNSEGHRANILNANFNYIGVGYDNNYWVQMFIGK